MWGRLAPGGAARLFCQGLALEGVNAAGLEALICMGPQSQRIRSKLGSASMVWCVSGAERSPAGKVERPVRVWNELVAEERGDRGLAEVAGAQRGLVARSQLVDLGIGEGSVRHRVAKGALHVVFPSAFAVGSPALASWGVETAALLHAGENAVLSHDSAAALWGLTSSPSFVAITLIGRRIRDQPGLRVHRVGALDIRDVRLRGGLPVTAPARTLIDCAAGDLPIDRLLNEARALNRVKDTEIHAAIDRCPGRPGIAALRALLEAELDSGFTRSGVERRLKALVRESGIEPPIFNTYVEGVEADAYWARHRVVIEVDGYLTHGRWAKFQSDRARDNKLVTAGYVVLRFTWHQLTQRPMQVAVQIAQALTRLELKRA
jgi:very-short-patch-repair endonuclease